METHLHTSTTAERKGTAGTRSHRLATTACAVAGTAFLIDTVTITILDGPFDPLDSILFFAGLIAGLVGVFAAAAFVTHGHRPKRLPRWAWTTALGVAFVLAGGTIVDLLGSVARAAYTGDNYGLQYEWDFFIFGLLLLAGALALSRAGEARSGRRDTTTPLTPSPVARAARQRRRARSSLPHQEGRRNRSADSGT